MRQALITIYEMEIVEYALPRVRIRVRCSKGTYIRSLAHEIGQRSAAEPISHPCAARAAADSRSKKRMNWMIFWKICKKLKQNSSFCV